MENLQKSADFYHISDHAHRGILDPKGFAQHFRLRCYLPSATMAPFVEHYFVSRRQAADTTYTATDLLTQPSVNMFFMNGRAYISGITVGKRVINAPIYAGAKFKPGGFYPFWQRSIAQLTEQRLAASRVFPGADRLFTQHLLALQNDQDIVMAIEQLLQSQHPRPERNIRLVTNILMAIDTDDSLNTVTAVARQFALSERSLQQLFRMYVGCGPKWCIRRSRFLLAIQYAHSQGRINWTIVAANLGYTTHSHFINDFKKLVGTTPAQYVKNL